MIASESSSNLERVLRALWYASTAIVMIALAVVMLVDARSIHGMDAVYPMVLLLAFSALGVIAFIRELRSAGTTASAEATDAVEGGRGRGVPWPSVGMVIAAIIVSFVIFVLFGYLASVFVASAAISAALGLRRIGWMVVFAVGTPLACYLLFAVALQSPIPDGVLLS
ncbi:tripartite tricarboxylate transporter TctB family protein [Microbacterium soli]|uniref:DUF1468 domain-containing protein n=1 Tax=Microbacterium soli TaxID=446075 RepID=A0ABP7MS81_9MICO